MIIIIESATILLSLHLSVDSDVIQVSEQAGTVLLVGI